jgi:hypothetical protein
MLKDNAVGKHSAILNNILETIGQTPLIRLHPTHLPVSRRDAFISSEGLGNDLGAWLEQ